MGSRGWHLPGRGGPRPVGAGRVVRVLVRRAGSRDLDALVELCAGLFAEDGGQRDPAIDVGWASREGRRYFQVSVLR